jgi:hypothetical protein
MYHPMMSKCPIINLNYHISINFIYLYIVDKKNKELMYLAYFESATQIANMYL